MGDSINKSRVLVFIPNYLPGYKYGGILRSVVNAVEWLSDSYEFWIVTRDRDLGEVEPYPNIETGKWSAVAGAMICYLSPEMISTRKLAKLVQDTPHDVIHLNSFFDSVFTLRILLARRMGWLPRRPLILSPRGEFVEGPLRLKYKKKRTYITLTKNLGFYKDVIWHASSKYERQDFHNALKVDTLNVRIALDLPNKVNLELPAGDLLSDDCLRLVFLSRLTREKNLDCALRVLREVKVKVVFDIYGPDEDLAYFNECQALIEQLPANVTATYCGSVLPTEVATIFSGYDLFFFPTRGENYGHVIAESVSVGTKVLISKNTPWLDLQELDLGWDVELEDQRRFVDIIEGFSAQTLEERLKQRSVVKQSALRRLLDPEVFNDNRQLFRSTNYPSVVGC